jgi:hypothetical protein
MVKARARVKAAAKRERQGLEAFARASTPPIFLATFLFSICTKSFHLL